MNEVQQSFLPLILLECFLLPLYVQKYIKCIILYLPLRQESHYSLALLSCLYKILSKYILSVNSFMQVLDAESVRLSCGYSVYGGTNKATRLLCNEASFPGGEPWNETRAHDYRIVIRTTLTFSLGMRLLH